MIRMKTVIWPITEPINKIWNKMTLRYRVFDEDTGESMVLETTFKGKLNSFIERLEKLENYIKAHETDILKKKINEVLDDIDTTIKEAREALNQPPEPLAKFVGVIAEDKSEAAVASNLGVLEEILKEDEELVLERLKTPLKYSPGVSLYEYD